MPLRRTALFAACALALSACAGGQQTPQQLDAGVAGNAQSMHRALWEMAENSQRGNDYDTAARHFATLLEVDPTSEAAILGRARNLRYGAKPYDAVLFLDEKIAALGPRPALTLELAKAHLADDAPAKALPHLLALESSQPDNWEVHSALGVLHDREGRMAEGMAAHQKAYKLAPLEPQAANNLALALAMNGQIDQAIDTLIPVSKRSEAPVNALQNLALFYAMRGQMDRAEPLVRRALPPEMAEQSIRSLRAISTQAKLGS
ncbi:MAG: tetratricopeptide repeat protein [Rhodospirillaceae bacterium]